MLSLWLPLFYSAALLVWLYRAGRALRFLRKCPEVLPSQAFRNKSPRVSVLLPVKNEEANLEAWLTRLLAQDDPAYEIIVTNDHSTDRTPEILARFERLNPGRLKVLEAPRVPEGWTGKNWALAKGEREARGEWLLFTDADTRFEPSAISSAVRHAEERGLDFLTLSPRCLVEGFWEKLLEPFAMAFFGLWFPLEKANDPHSPVVFGNGQFLMMRKTLYEKIGGHEKVKGNYLEDFALFSQAKKAGARVECARGTKIFGTRMYRSFSGIWSGWRRIFLHAFEKNAVRLSLKAALLFLFSVLPFVLSPLLAPWPVAALSVFALIFVTSAGAYGLVGAPSAYALLHPLAGLILSGILFDAASLAFRKKEVSWR